MTLTPQLAQQCLEALESCTPGDWSTGHVIHPSHDEVAVEAAILALREALASGEGDEAPPGMKMVGYTCGEGDCGRIHDECHSDGYMVPVYVRAAMKGNGK